MKNRKREKWLKELYNRAQWFWGWGDTVIHQGNTTTTTATEFTIDEAGSSGNWVAVDVAKFPDNTITITGCSADTFAAGDIIQVTK